MIDPGEIPQIPGDMHALAAHAGAITKVGGDFASTGQRINATWQALAGAYRAPEAAQLFAATAPVQSVSASVGQDLETVGAALSTYAAEVAEIKRQLAVLQSQAGSFLESVAGDDDWRGQQAKVDQHNGLIQLVNTQVAAFFDAQRRCANTINALYGARQYRAEDGDGHLQHGEYGFTAEVLTAAAGQDGVLPWGSSEEHDRGFLGDTGAYFAGLGEGFTSMLGDLGSLIGRDPETGQWAWSTAGSAWTGAGTFVYAVAIRGNPVTTVLDHTTGMPGLERHGAANLLLNAGKSIIAYDQWGQDKARAGGIATFNIVSAIVGTKGAGASLRGAGTAAQTIRGSATAAQISNGLLRTGTYLDNLPSTTQITTRIADKFTIHIPKFQFSPIAAYADGIPGGGHRFDVEMPEPRGPETFHMDTGSGGHGGHLPGENGPGGAMPDLNDPVGSLPGSNDLGGHGPIGKEPAGNGPGGNGLGADTPGSTTPEPLSPAQREQFTNSAQRLGMEAEQRAYEVLARHDLPPGTLDRAVRDFTDLHDSGRLAGTPDRQAVILNNVLEKLNGRHSDFEGAAAELRAFNDVINSEDLAPGSRVAFNPVYGEPIDLGNGTVLTIGDVPEADLVYQTADGTVHLDEVKTTAQTLASKLKSDPQQLGRMLAWQDAAPGRAVGIRVSTDQGWTGLFSTTVKDPPTMGIEAIARTGVTVTFGSRTLSPGQLNSLLAAVERAASDPRHPMTKSGPWFTEHMPTLDAAREFLKGYGVDFL